MTEFLFSVQQVMETRLCAAAACKEDAESGSALCRWCEAWRRRGHTIILHHVEQPPIPDETRELWCSGCSRWLEDAAFSLQSSYHWRRQRRKECRKCDARRRSLHRQKLPLDKYADLLDREAARKRQDTINRRNARLEAGP